MQQCQSPNIGERQLQFTVAPTYVPVCCGFAERYIRGQRNLFHLFYLFAVLLTPQDKVSCYRRINLFFLFFFAFPPFFLWCLVRFTTTFICNEVVLRQGGRFWGEKWLQVKLTASALCFALLHFFFVYCCFDTLLRRAVCVFVEKTSVFESKRRVRCSHYSLLCTNGVYPPPVVGQDSDGVRK